MKNPESLNVMTGRKNGDISLESILGDKIPKDPLKIAYCETILRCRAIGMQTGTIPYTDEIRSKLRSIIEECPNILKETAEQRYLIYNATKQPNGKIRVNENAFVVHGEIKPGELSAS